MMENMKIWNAVKQPPPEALKKITGVRGLSGKTDINPQWRLQALTEQYGPCGTGWYYEIIRLWNEPTIEGQVFCFAHINIYTKTGDEWSKPVTGVGGNMLVKKETSGNHASDEGYKMAITDALSVACKALGIAADVYAGRWDGDKYNEPVVVEYITEKQQNEITDMLNATDSDGVKFLKWIKAPSIQKMTQAQYDSAMKKLKEKSGKAAA